MEKDKGDKDTTPSKTQRKPTPAVSRVLPDGTLVELVSEARTTAFIVAKNGSWARQASVRVSKNAVLTPYSPHNSLVRHRVVLFPSEPIEYESDSALVASIRNYIHHYVDVSDEFLDIAVHYVLFSWLYDTVNELPYLRTQGDFGSGKTRFLQIVGSICYKPIFASGASTISPIFHMLDAFGGTLILDEADFRISDEKAEIVKILNNGNVRGFPVLRSEQSPTNEFNPRAFSVYGPKIVATRNTYDDRALESRFITEHMQRKRLRSDIPINLPTSYRQEAQVLRNQLLLFRIRNHSTKTNLVDSVDRTIEPRLAQIFTPLLVTIRDPLVRASVLERIHTMDRDMKGNRKDALDRNLLTVIRAQSLQHPEKALAVGDICKTFNAEYAATYLKPITARRVGAILRNRFKLHPVKRNGVFVIDSEATPQLTALYEHYGLNDS